MSRNARGYFWWYVTSFVLGVSRLAGMSGPSFQAVAHLFVGALLYAWFADHDREMKRLAIVLSIIEVCQAIADRLDLIVSMAVN